MATLLSYFTPFKVHLKMLTNYKMQQNNIRVHEIVSYRYESSKAPTRNVICPIRMAALLNSHLGLTSINFGHFPSSLNVLTDVSLWAQVPLTMR